LQVTAGSLTGTFGPQVQKLASWLVEQRLVHFIASDAHATKTRPPQLSPAFARVAELAGEKTAIELCCRNPKSVAAGATVLPARQKTARTGWTNWFYQTFTSEYSEA
jgi:protein-tyrosine phosphatase